MAVFQSGFSAQGAARAWQAMEDEGLICRMRSRFDLPDRRTREVVPSVDLTRYHYIRNTCLPSDGFTVVYRGLEPGVYPLW